MIMLVPLLVSATLLFVSAPAAAASVSVSPTTVSPGETVTVSVRGSTKVGDWYQIVPISTADNVISAGWRYLNGRQNYPTTVMPDVDLPVTAPATAGTYEVRLYLDYSRTVAARASLTVRASTTGLPGPMGPPGPVGPMGPVGPVGPKGNMAQGTPTRGAVCVKGDSSYDIERTGGEFAMIVFYVCDPTTLKWLRTQQFPATPW